MIQGNDPSEAHFKTMRGVATIAEKTNPRLAPPDGGFEAWSMVHYYYLLNVALLTVFFYFLFRDISNYFGHFASSPSFKILYSPLTTALKVGSSFIVLMHSSSMHYIFGIFFVEWLNEFPGESRAAVSGCVSVATSCMFGAAFWGGRLQHRWGSQGAVVLTGACLATAGLLLTSFATKLWHFYIVFSVLVGVGHAFAFPPCPVVVSTWFTAQSGLALGVTTAGGKFKLEFC